HAQRLSDAVNLEIELELVNVALPEIEAVDLGDRAGVPAEVAVVDALDAVGRRPARRVRGHTSSGAIGRARDQGAGRPGDAHFFGRIGALEPVDPAAGRADRAAERAARSHGRPAHVPGVAVAPHEIAAGR